MIFLFLNATKFLNALNSLKVVKDRILGKVRKTGWQESIKNFRRKWQDTGSWLLNMSYLIILKNISINLKIGAAISSEQSEEMLHSRIQRVWHLRNTRLEYLRTNF